MTIEAHVISDYQMKTPLLFVSDLDKTLLLDSGTPSAFTREAWNLLYEKGVLLSVATSRGPSMVHQILKGFEISLPIITMNGAIVWDYRNKIPIQVHSLPVSIVSTLLLIGESCGLSPFLFHFDGSQEVRYYLSLQNRGQKHFFDKRKGTRGEPHRVSSFTMCSFDQCIALNFIGSKKEIGALKEAILAEFAGRVELKAAQDPYSKDFWSLEVLHPDADKSIALQSVCKMVGIPPANLVVFGDGENDFGMFKTAGLSYAVRNAVNSVKEGATHILDRDNNSDAVIIAIKALSLVGEPD